MVWPWTEFARTPTPGKISNCLECAPFANNLSLSFKLGRKWLDRKLLLSGWEECFFKADKYYRFSWLYLSTLFISVNLSVSYLGASTVRHTHSSTYTPTYTPATHSFTFIIFGRHTIETRYNPFLLLSSCGLRVSFEGPAVALWPACDSSIDLHNHWKGQQYYLQVFKTCPSLSPTGVQMLICFYFYIF